jgi:hypothetical protein
MNNNMENSYDFTVWVNERYDMSKEEFERHMTWADALEKELGFELPTEFKRKKLKYEEDSCMHRMPQVDYNKLFVGAHLYYDTAPFDRLGTNFDEIEVTHLYGGVMFFRILEGKRMGEEDFLPVSSFGFM